MKWLREQDLKRQAELDDLVKAKNAADKEHAERQDAAQKEVTRLKDALARLREVESEQHKMEQHLKRQIGSLAMALKGTLFRFP